MLVITFFIFRRIKKQIMAKQLLLQLALILLNAFFAATEMAIVSLNENKVRKLAESGDKKAVKMLKMVEEPNGFLSTIQIGITLAGFLGSAFAADTFSDKLVTWLVEGCGVTIPESALNAIAVVVITIILSYFTLVLGELVPKRIAMKHSDKLAMAVCGFISGMSTVLKPIVWLLSKSTNIMLRVFGINPNEIGENVTEEDIMVMIDAAEEGGDIDAEAKEMIENVFDFDDMTVSDLMVHRTEMTVIWENDSTEDILKTIVDSGFSRFPVCGERMDDVMGIVRAREYLLALRNNEQVDLSEIMQDAFFVPESIKANKLLEEMKKNKCHMAIVVDEYGGTEGLVTMEDLIEEIVGDIYDETDKEEPVDITQISENSWRIYGNADLEDVMEVIDLTVSDEEDEDFTTFSGFIIAQLEYIPQIGQRPSFEYGNFLIKVEQMSDKKVEWAIVKKIKEKEEEE